MATPGRLRDIFEEPLFSEQLEGLAISYRKRDEVMEALGFVLARSPEIFPTVPGTSLSVVTVNLYADLPRLLFLFTYDDHRVRLVGVEFAATTDATNA